MVFKHGGNSSPKSNKPITQKMSPSKDDLKKQLKAMEIKLEQIRAQGMKIYFVNSYIFLNLNVFCYTARQ